MYNQDCQKLGSAPNMIRKLFAYGMEKAKEIGPENVYDFSIGNPSVPAPERVNESIKEILDEVDSIKVHGYSMSTGFEETRAAIAKDLSERFGVDAKTGEIFVSCGAAPALLSVIRALIVSPETEILISAPFFPEYVPFTEANGGKPVIVPPDYETFQVNIKGVEAAINENTQALIINSPNNPSGVVFTKENLEALAELLTRKSAEIGHPIYLISDEPYRELVYDGIEVPFVPTIYKNTIVCYSYSKSLSLPGERIGYVYVPGFADDSADVFFAVAGAARASGHICATTLIQMMLERCIKERPNLKPYEENRAILYKNLVEMGYECVRPDGAFYLLVKAPGGDSVAFAEKAKLDYNLLFVPCDGFGCPGYIRLSYCVPNEMIKRSFKAFKALIEEYK